MQSFQGRENKVSQFKDLEEIVGKSESVTISGKSFEVYELSIKSILNVFKKLGKLNLRDQSGFMSALAENFDIAIELVAYATKSPINDVKQAVEKNQISLDDFTELTTKAVEVNADIFLSAIEKVTKASEKLNMQATSLKKKS